MTKLINIASTSLNILENMVWTNSLLVWSVIILLPLLAVLRRRLGKSGSRRLPPGPPGWPVFGHLFKLGTLPHRTLAGLKQQYGPVVWIKLGSVNTLVIQSAKVAADFFRNHDLTFADRYIIEIMKTHDYYKGSIALAPYGTYWRSVRRICTVEMFVSKKINQTMPIRQKCIDDLLTWIQKESNSVKEGSGIQITRYIFLALFNIIGNLMLSRDLVDPRSMAGTEFFTILLTMIPTSGNPNISDAFPWLRWFDLQGLKRQADQEFGKLLEIISGFVKERLKERQAGGERAKDFLDVLLDFRGSGKDEVDKLSEHEIHIFIMEMFLGGAETTSTSIEWALAELLRNPEAMAKVKAELDNVVGPNRKYQESDIENSHYLQAAVKESMRLHPPVPFLVPRKSTQDTTFWGYYIPKGTQVFVNAWAIGRDPEVWDDPMSFKPERFLNSQIDFKGQNYELIPFGAGRRMCVGLPLAHRVVHMVLGSLFHEFHLELSGNVTPKTLDMKETMGVVVRKAELLLVDPKKRVL